MFFVKLCTSLPRRISGGGTGEFVGVSSDQMPEGVAAEGVTAQEYGVQCKDDTAYADPKRPISEVRLNSIVGKNEHEYDREIQGVAVQVLDNQAGVQLARMSGSGATCFALFDNEESCAAARRGIAQSHPDWWSLATELL